MKHVLTQLTLSGVLFLVALGGYAYWYHVLGEVNAQVAELSAAADAKAANAATSDLAAGELAARAAAANDIQAYFVASGNVVGFLEALQSLGSGLGAGVSVVSVTANASPRAHLDLALSVSGTFAAVMRAAGAIEYAPYDVTMKTLTLSTSSVDPNAPWTAAMTLSVGTASSTPPKTP